MIAPAPRRISRGDGSAVLGPWQGPRATTERGLNPECRGHPCSPLDLPEEILGRDELGDARRLARQPIDLLIADHR